MNITQTQACQISSSQDHIICFIQSHSELDSLLQIWPNPGACGVVWKGSNIDLNEFGTWCWKVYLHRGKKNPATSPSSCMQSLFSSLLKNKESIMKITRTFQEFYFKKSKISTLIWGFHVLGQLNPVRAILLISYRQNFLEVPRKISSTFKKQTIYGNIFHHWSPETQNFHDRYHSSKNDVSEILLIKSPKMFPWIDRMYCGF